jgi:hypothetical protein
MDMLNDCIHLLRSMAMTFFGVKFCPSKHAVDQEYLDKINI